jgi:hypothetical protein
MKRLVSVILLAALVGLVAVPMASSQIRINLKGRALNDYPGTWAIANGLNVVGKGERLYALVDTLGSKLPGPASWALTVPPGSTTTLDSANTLGTSFKADTIGFYYLSVTLGTTTVYDTVYASTYAGITEGFSDYPSGCYCHPSGTRQYAAFADWKNTGHAQMFKLGMTGRLEVEANPLDGKSYGTYGANCIQCHTTGFNKAVSNNNYANQAAATGFDTTWYKSFTKVGTSYWLAAGDTTVYSMLNVEQKMVGSIGCESCHGPLYGHKTPGQPGGLTTSSVAVSYAPDVCNQCHNGSSRHSLGLYYNLSAHAAYPVLEPRSNCAPCHQGYSFVKWTKSNKDTTHWASLLTDAQLNTTISCQTCHDPHKAATINPDGSLDPGLRDASIGQLRNGFKFTPAGYSQVCSYCHSSRYSVNDRVIPNKPPYYGFSDRFGPHGNPQMDMLVGGNGYEFGDASISGVTTHSGLEDGCVTCHMQPRTRSNNTLSNHSMKMVGDTLYGFNAMKVCASCHGEIADPNEVKAFYDFDRNGKIEGVQTEIQGLLNALKTMLPLDASGNPVTRTSDSLKVKGRLDYVAGIWNYYFVVNDGSMGVHNASYAARLLYKSLGWTPLWIKDIQGEVPSTIALKQNYPNPFNPTTTIGFSLPKEQHVRLAVYDMTGQLVKTLLDEGVRAGNKEITWDGTSATGAKVASGMYLYRLETEGSALTQKMVLLK